MPPKKIKKESGDWIQQLKIIKSPVDISLSICTKYQCPPLEFNYYDEVPSKLKMTNTGNTVLIRGIWSADRPCMENGPFSDKYIFTQMHFHWGKTTTSGSEHTADGEKYSMEMHVVHFKREYIFPEVAKTKDDGLAILVYLLKSWPNPRFDNIIKYLSEIKKTNTSYIMMLDPLSTFFPTFSDDFFIYRGTLDLTTTNNVAIWVVSRIPISISEDQIKEFYTLQNPNKKPIMENIREIEPAIKEAIHFVNPSPTQFATMKRAV